MTIPTLYKLSSSQAHCIQWALEEVASSHGIKYNVKNLSRRGKSTNADLKTVFPLGKSPILTLEPVDGEPPVTLQIKPNVLTESRLVLHFISDNYSNGEWIPESDSDKHRDIFFQELAKSTLLEKVVFALFLEVVGVMLPFGFRQLMGLLARPVVGHFVSDQRVVYQLMEEALSEELPWFAGKKIGIADFCFSFPMDMAAQRGYFEAEQYPKVAEWHQRIHDRPAYERALEKGGPYDLVKFT
jgi:glutathione S-transferase